MTRLPAIIIVHRGASEVARTAIAQACFYYDGEVVLLHDGVEGVEGNLTCVHIGRFKEDAAEFERIYRHISLNDESYERFCFSRWFLIAGFMRQSRRQRAVAMDSDAFVYHGINQVVARLALQSFTSWTHFTSLHLDSLHGLCEFILDIYRSPPRLDALAQSVKVEAGLDHLHLSDMDFFGEFMRRNGGLNMNGTFPELGVDPNINLANGCVMDGSYKKLTWIGTIPHITCEASRLMSPVNLLHLQGRAKIISTKLRSAPISAEPMLLGASMDAAKRARV